MNIRERLAQKKAASNPSSLRDRLNKNKGGSTLKRSISSGTSNTGGIRNKFKKREQSVLDKTYESRDEQSKFGGVGKPLFNQELMKQFEIEDFKTSPGDRFVEILPISFDPTVPYFKEISVHFGVGFNNDAFICLNRLNQGRCYRCEFQQKMWRDQETYTKDQTKQLYPMDRCVYLMWERTKELVEGESPDFTFQLWAAPKKKVHFEIQEKVRNKITKETLDISDLSIDGDGRTISFTIQKNKGSFPEYRAFDLLQRDVPIPDEVVMKLEEIVNYSQEQGYNNCLEMFYNIPDYDEIKESMETEFDDDNSESNETPTGTTGQQRTSFNRSNVSSTPSNTGTSQGDSEEEEIMAYLEELQGELEVISKNPLKWRKWCNENDYSDALGMSTDEAITAIIDDMYEKTIAEMKGNHH